MTKQESLRKSYDKLFAEYELTPLELNVLVYIQGQILSRILTHGGKK